MRTCRTCEFKKPGIGADLHICVNSPLSLEYRPVLSGEGCRQHEVSQKIIKTASKLLRLQGTQEKIWFGISEDIVEYYLPVYLEEVLNYVEGLISKLPKIEKTGVHWSET